MGMDFSTYTHVALLRISSRLLRPYFKNMGKDMQLRLIKITHSRQAKSLSWAYLVN